MNLYKQKYSHTKPFIKSPHILKYEMNFKGGVFEASFYESLINELKDEKKHSFRLVGKDSYAPKGKTFIKDGFFCDSFGKCIYNSNSLSMAEFDAIKVNDKSLIFYECTLTQKKENLRSANKDFDRKLTLLKFLFPNKKITCVVVSDNEETLRRFKYLEGYEILVYQMPNVDLLDIAKRSKYERISPPHMVMSANSLNKMSSNFNYLTEFIKLNSSLCNGGTLTSLKQKLLSNNGLFPRLYWGKVPSQQLIDVIGSVEADFIVISINLSNSNNPKLRYYFMQGKRSVFEASSKPKLLGKRKSSLAEIKAIEKKLPGRTRLDLAQLEEEIKNWKSLND